MTDTDDAAPKDGPLAGLRLIELAGMGVVPYIATVLGDLGADVIRVDRITGDPFKEASNTYKGRPTDFLIRRSRRSIALDLKNPQGVEVLLGLVESAAGMFEGYRPGVAERLGVGPEQCHARNPKLVYVRATGWGQEGPYSRAPGHDLNYIALSGALLAMGRKDTPPPPPLNFVGDFAGGALFAVIGFLSAHVHALQTGVGQVVNASMIDGVIHLTGMYHGMLANGAWTEERESNLLDGGSPLYDVYETSDGRYFSVAAGEPQFVAALLEQLGLTERFAGVDVRKREAWPEVRAALTEAFLTKTRDEWTDLLAGQSNQCCAPVLSFSEAPHNVHNHTRGSFQEVEEVLQPVPAPRFDRTPARLNRPPAKQGQHTVGILTQAGFDQAGIDRLLESGAALQA